MAAAIALCQVGSSMLCGAEQHGVAKLAGACVTCTQHRPWDGVDSPQRQKHTDWLLSKPNRQEVDTAHPPAGTCRPPYGAAISTMAACTECALLCCCPICTSAPTRRLVSATLLKAQDLADRQLHQRELAGVLEHAADVRLRRACICVDLAAEVLQQFREHMPRGIALLQLPEDVDQVGLSLAEV